MEDYLSLWSSNVDEIALVDRPATHPGTAISTDLVSNNNLAASSRRRYIRRSSQIPAIRYPGSGVTPSIPTFHLFAPTTKRKDGLVLASCIRYAESPTVEDGYRLTNSSFFVDTPTLSDIEGWSRGETPPR